MRGWPAPPLRVVAQRAALSWAALVLVETAFVYQTGSAPFGMVLTVFAGQAALVLILVLLAALAALAHRSATAVTLLGGPVVLSAARAGLGSGQIGAAREAGLRWGLTAVLLLALWVTLRRAPSHRRLLVAAIVSSAVATAGLVARSVDVGDLYRSPFAHFGIAALVAAATVVAAMVVGDSWRRVLASVIVLVGAALGLARWRQSGLGLDASPVKAASNVSGPRGILLITLDTTRRDHLPLYGYARDTTPALAQLARRSVVFDHAYASAPYTLSAHASIFTGLLPSEHGAHRRASVAGRIPRDAPLPGNIPTLAGQLADAGYRTAGIAANFAYLDEWTGLNRGFDSYATGPRVDLGYYPLGLSVRRTVMGGLPRKTWLEAAPAAEVTDAAIGWLENTGAEPFFLFLNYFDAHEYAADLRKEDRPSPFAPGPAGTAALLRRYDEGLRGLDGEVGRLLDWLSRRGLDDRMLIVVTADHGEYFGEHGLWLHGHDLHEPVLAIPLIVKFPGGGPTGREAVRVSQQQLLPLIMAMGRGESGADVLSRLAMPEPRLVAQSWPRDNVAKRCGWVVGRAVYEGRWKLIERLGAPSSLYDLDTDPGEDRDLFSAEPARAARRFEEMTASLPPLREAVLSPASAPVEPDSESMERLRGLGYVGH